MKGRNKEAGKNARKNQNSTTKYIYKSTHYNKIKTKKKKVLD